ncbi:unnamed protein product [Amoebophrya sp. A25]|nr:unnamed protein product [Amoebophrya sp. A25]|eukprot:GSA25T00001880001.1
MPPRIPVAVRLARVAALVAEDDTRLSHYLREKVPALGACAASPATPAEYSSKDLYELTQKTIDEFQITALPALEALSAHYKKEVAAPPISEGAKCSKSGAVQYYRTLLQLVVTCLQQEEDERKKRKQETGGSVADQGAPRVASHRLEVAAANSTTSSSVHQTAGSATLARSTGGGASNPVLVVATPSALSVGAASSMNTPLSIATPYGPYGTVPGGNPLVTQHTTTAATTSMVRRPEYASSNNRELYVLHGAGSVSDNSTSFIDHQSVSTSSAASTFPATRTRRPQRVQLVPGGVDSVGGRDVLMATTAICSQGASLVDPGISLSSSPFVGYGGPGSVPMVTRSPLMTAGLSRSVRSSLGGARGTVLHGSASASSLGNAAATPGVVPGTLPASSSTSSSLFPTTTRAAVARSVSPLASGKRRTIASSNKNGGAGKTTHSATLVKQYTQSATANLTGSSSASSSIEQVTLPITAINGGLAPPAGLFVGTIGTPVLSSAAAAMTEVVAAGNLIGALEKVAEGGAAEVKVLGATSCAGKSEEEPNAIVGEDESKRKSEPTTTASEDEPVPNRNSLPLVVASTTRAPEIRAGEQATSLPLQPVLSYYNDGRDDTDTNENAVPLPKRGSIWQSAGTAEASGSKSVGERQNMLVIESSVADPREHDIDPMTHVGGSAETLDFLTGENIVVATPHSRGEEELRDALEQAVRWNEDLRDRLSDRDSELIKVISEGTAGESNRDELAKKLVEALQREVAKISSPKRPALSPVWQRRAEAASHLLAPGGGSGLQTSSGLASSLGGPIGSTGVDNLVFARQAEQIGKMHDQIAALESRNSTLARELEMSKCECVRLEAELRAANARADVHECALQTKIAEDDADLFHSEDFMRRVTSVYPVDAPAPRRGGPCRRVVLRDEGEAIAAHEEGEEEPEDATTTDSAVDRRRLDIRATARVSQVTSETTGAGGDGLLGTIEGQAVDVPGAAATNDTASRHRAPTLDALLRSSSQMRDEIAAMERRGGLGSPYGSPQGTRSSGISPSSASPKPLNYNFYPENLVSNVYEQSEENFPDDPEGDYVDGQKCTDRVLHALDEVRVLMEPMLKRVASTDHCPPGDHQRDPEGYGGTMNDIDDFFGDPGTAHYSISNDNVSRYNIGSDADEHSGRSRRQFSWRGNGGADVPGDLDYEMGAGLGLVDGYPATFPRHTASLPQPDASPVRPAFLRRRRDESAATRLRNRNQQRSGGGTDQLSRPRSAAFMKLAASLSPSTRRKWWRNRRCNAARNAVSGSKLMRGQQRSQTAIQQQSLGGSSRAGLFSSFYQEDTNSSYGVDSPSGERGQQNSLYTFHSSRNYAGGGHGGGGVFDVDQHEVALPPSFVKRYSKKASSSQSVSKTPVIAPSSFDEKGMEEEGGSHPSGRRPAEMSHVLPRMNTRAGESRSHHPNRPRSRQDGRNGSAFAKADFPLNNVTSTSTSPSFFNNSRLDATNYSGDHQLQQPPESSSNFYSREDDSSSRSPAKQLWDPTPKDRIARATPSAAQESIGGPNIVLEQLPPAMQNSSSVVVLPNEDAEEAFPEVPPLSPDDDENEEYETDQDEIDVTAGTTTAANAKEQVEPGVFSGDVAIAASSTATRTPASADAASVRGRSCSKYELQKCVSSSNLTNGVQQTAGKPNAAKREDVLATNGTNITNTTAKARGPLVLGQPTDELVPKEVRCLKEQILAQNQRLADALRRVRAMKGQNDSVSETTESK